MELRMDSKTATPVRACDWRSSLSLQRQSEIGQAVYRAFERDTEGDEDRTEVVHDHFDGRVGGVVADRNAADVHEQPERAG